MSHLKYIEVKGREIEKYIDSLADLRISVFREFPYLYDGSFEYEQKYLKVYCENDDSFVCLALYEDEVIGASTGTALINEPEYVTRPLSDAGYKLEDIFYFGESVLRKEYRGKGIGWQFMKSRENFALSLNKSLAVFCAVERAMDHPRKPSDFFSLEKFWKKAGYRALDISGSFSWQDLDEDHESPKKMNYWGKELGKKNPARKRD